MLCSERACKHPHSKLLLVRLSWFSRICFSLYSNPFGKTSLTYCCLREAVKMKVISLFVSATDSWSPREGVQLLMEMDFSWHWTKHIKVCLFAPLNVYCCFLPPLASYHYAGRGWERLGGRSPISAPFEIGELAGPDRGAALLFRCPFGFASPSISMLKMGN